MKLLDVPLPMSYAYEEDEEGSIVVLATVPAAYFSCSNCHLVLDQYELIKQAGLPETFEAVDDDDDFEPDYGND